MGMAAYVVRVHKTQLTMISADVQTAATVPLGIATVDHDVHQHTYHYENDLSRHCDSAAHFTSAPHINLLCTHLLAGAGGTHECSIIQCSICPAS